MTQDLGMAWDWGWHLRPWSLKLNHWSLNPTLKSLSLSPVDWSQISMSAYGLPGKRSICGSQYIIIVVKLMKHHYAPESVFRESLPVFWEKKHTEKYAMFAYSFLPRKHSCTKETWSSLYVFECNADVVPHCSGWMLWEGWTPSSQCLQCVQKNILPCQSPSKIKYPIK